MPVLIRTNYQRPLEADLHMYAVLGLVEKREKHTFHQNILRCILCILIMTSLTLKTAIALVIYLLHAESENLRVIHQHLLDLVRNTPESVLETIVSTPRNPKIGFTDNLCAIICSVINYQNIFKLCNLHLNNLHLKTTDCGGWVNKRTLIVEEG